MPPNKLICVCIPFRLAVFLVLIFIFVCTLLSVYNHLMIIGDPMFKDFMIEYGENIYVELIWGSITSLIFLAAIVSIIKNAPNLIFLKLSVVVLSWTVFCMISYLLFDSTYDEDDKYHEILFEKQVQSYPEEFRREIRVRMDYTHRTVKDVVFAYFAKIGVMLLSMGLLRSFIEQSKESSVNGEIENV